MAVLQHAVRADSPEGPRKSVVNCAYAITFPASHAAIDGAAQAAVYLGFDALLALAASPADPAAENAAVALAHLVKAAHAHGLQAWTSVSPARIESQHELARAVAPAAFTAPPLLPTNIADPRREFPRGQGVVRIRNISDHTYVDWWAGRLRGLRRLGLDGVALIDDGLAGEHVMELFAQFDVPARQFESALYPAPTAADCATSPLVTANSLRDDLRARRDVFANIAMSGTSWAMTAGMDDGLDAAVRSVNRTLHDWQTQGAAVRRRWTGPDAPLEIISAAIGGAALVMVRNNSREEAPWPPEHLPAMQWQIFSPVPGFGHGVTIKPGHSALFDANAEEPARNAADWTAREAAEPGRRVAITRVSPSVDGGAFCVKVVIAETVRVEADIFADGHEQLAAVVLTRQAGAQGWTSHAMTAQPNDVWQADVRFLRLGIHEIRVEAWIDEWGGFARDFSRKVEAGQDVALEIREGRAMIAAAAARSSGDLAKTLDSIAAKIDQADAAQQAQIFAAPELSPAMSAADMRNFLASSFIQPVRVEREAARFASWYELFPRSQSPKPGEHGTFADVAAKLPKIAAMGFDTVYFPPIHPIGARNRKGRNNNVVAEAGDVGSPYAIGSAEGGHTDIHKQLGTLAEFQHLLVQAAEYGLEIAIDFAIQCAPDHPWLKEHPGWFAWRPDGSIKYAENPPKKYQDIVNVDFYAESAVPDLWLALRDVVLFWAEQGVRVFRVDNPHTKPLPFWAWMISEVQQSFPGAIFLSEAFTRPKPMYQLAKSGFSQSYTYFTWRNEKAEITNYVEELTQAGVREFFRPHFFVNTPDINPLFLQNSGRPGFLIRAALAATLSGLWGVYSGFEFCESAALPGREEYLDSEKYQLRQRSARAPGDIVDEVTQLNQLRRTFPALQSHLTTEFHNAFNDRVIYYSKSTQGENGRVLVMVSLDPNQAQDAEFEVPLWLFDLPDWESVYVRDLLTGVTFSWAGKTQHVRLTPDSPYAIWHITPRPGGLA